MGSKAVQNSKQEKWNGAAASQRTSRRLIVTGNDPTYGLKTLLFNPFSFCPIPTSKLRYQWLPRTCYSRSLLSLLFSIGFKQHPRLAQKKRLARRAFPQERREFVRARGGRASASIF